SFGVLQGERREGKEDLMLTRCFGSTAALVLTVAIVLLGSSRELLAQLFPDVPSDRKKPSVGKDWTPSRTPDGQPDLQGIYTGENWIAQLDRASPVFRSDDGTAVAQRSRIVDPADGKVPVQSWVVEKRKFLAAVNG